VVEIFSLARTKESIKRSDVAIIMIDATAFLYRDDISVIDYVIKNGKPCILIVNKWDLISDKDAKSYRRRLQDRLRMISWIPILFTSCKDKHNIIKAIDRACETAQRAKATIQTARINKLLERVQKEKPHPYSKRVRPKIFYATQISTAPPKFLLFCSKPGEIKREYLRFLERSFRMNFDLEGIPMVLELRKKE